MAHDLKFDFELIADDLDEQIKLAIRDLADGHFLPESGRGLAAK